MEQQMAAENPRKSKKESKNNKKKQPLKVVYITNPMKFTATASEFRALVQELTGQDADVPDISRYEAADAGAAAGEAPSEGGVHANSKSEVGGAAAGEKATSTDPSTSMSYEGYGFCGQEMMIEEFLGLESSRLWDDEGVDVDDVFKRLGAF